jgi:hypothetical protein
MPLAQQGVPLDQLLGYIERAACGERLLLVRLFRTMQQLARHPDALPEDRALGEILSQVLMGEREPDLSRLTPEMAEEVEAMLHRIRKPHNPVKPDAR